jgi:riboflavin synthase
MFTGIIEELGRLEAVEPRAAGIRLRITGPLVCGDLKAGDSVAVNGVCLTAVDVRAASFGADVSPETLKRSTLGGLAAGAVLNLERALTPASRMGGHIVQGHVDGVGEVVSLDLLGDSNWWLRLRLPAEVERYAVHKGSLAIDGISLTVAELQGDVAAVTIIPHTHASTNLRGRRAGDKVNLEADILAKYVEKLLGAAGTKSRLSVAGLLEQGY